MNNAVKVPPLRRSDIREETLKIREKCRCRTGRFPILEFLEFALPKVSNDYEFLVWESDEMGSNHGLTYPDEQIIILRQDIYDGAHMGNGRDRLTAAHELGHLVLHSNLPLCKAPPSKINAYESSEWQANCFAGELLIPFNEINCDMPIDEVAEIYGVSLKAAEYQLQIKAKESE